MIDYNIKASSSVNGLRLFRWFFLNVSQSRWLPNSLRCRFVRWGGVKLGNNCFIGQFVTFDTIRPDLITIGDNTLITANSMILSHFFKDGSFYYGKVEIGNNCFLGMNTIIVNAVSIGDNSIIGAGSIVTKDVPAGEVWAGNPAKFIRKHNTKK